VRSAMVRCGVWGSASGGDDVLGQSSSRAPHRDVSDFTCVGVTNNTSLSHSSIGGTSGCALLHGPHQTLYTNGGAIGVRDIKRDARVSVYHGSVDRRTRGSTLECHDEREDGAADALLHAPAGRFGTVSTGSRRASDTITGARDGDMHANIDGIDASSSLLRNVDGQKSLPNTANGRRARRDQLFTSSTRPSSSHGYSASSLAIGVRESSGWAIVELSKRRFLRPQRS